MRAATQRPASTGLEGGRPRRVGVSCARPPENMTVSPMRSAGRSSSRAASLGSCSAVGMAFMGAPAPGARSVRTTVARARRRAAAWAAACDSTRRRDAAARPTDEMARAAEASSSKREAAGAAPATAGAACDGAALPAEWADAAAAWGAGWAGAWPGLAWSPAPPAMAALPKAWPRRCWATSARTRAWCMSRGAAGQRAWRSRSRATYTRRDRASPSGSEPRGRCDSLEWGIAARGSERPVVPARSRSGPANAAPASRETRGVKRSRAVKKAERSSIMRPRRSDGRTTPSPSPWASAR
mmetsp:Transcript_3679/g.15270  ORF Transcript_3679/g.15270 Transcript_3679/m.15270 type:complete len:298 (-) Transcript_3679:4277-5170(-)